MFAIDTVFEVFLGRVGNALLALREKIATFAENDGVRWTYCSARRLLVFLQSLVEAEFTFDDLRIPLVPLELRYVERTSDFAITASDAKRAVPGDRSPCVLLQGPERAASNASRVEAVHALTLDKGEVISVSLAIELDNVLRLGVEIGGNIPQPGRDCGIDGTQRFGGQAVR